MRTSSVSPRGAERTFDADEIIVTKTDLQGRITYGNDVFLRMSALTEEDALGQPHNIIRHPDMPRAVFKLLWDTIKEGREIFAYVLNLAADGTQYWVFAHVTPSINNAGQTVGYHSTRRKPDPGTIVTVRTLYDQIRAAERRQTAAPAALDAGYDTLSATLAERGQTYDEFVWDLTNGSHP